MRDLSEDDKIQIQTPVQMDLQDTADPLSTHTPGCSLTLLQRSTADERRRNNRGHKSVFSETHFISCQSVMQHIQYKEQQGLQSCSEQKWNSCAA